MKLSCIWMAGAVIAIATASLGAQTPAFLDGAGKPILPGQFSYPGSTGPSRGWYVWHAFNPETWEATISRDPPGDAWTVPVLPWATTYRHLVYGAKPHELLPGERLNVFLSPSPKSKWGYVVHFQDELCQMKGHNHAWKVRSVAGDGQGFEAQLWMGNEKKLDDKALTFEIAANCQHWRQGKRVDRPELKAGDHVYTTWVWQVKRRVVKLLADDESLPAIRKAMEERVRRDMESEGAAGIVHQCDGDVAHFMVFSTYWAQRPLFKIDGPVKLRAVGKGYRPTGEPMDAKLLSWKAGGQYGSGPAEVQLQLLTKEAAKRIKTLDESMILRMIAR